MKVPGKAEDHLKNRAENANLQLLNLTYVSIHIPAIFFPDNIPFDGGNCVYLIGMMQLLLIMCR